MFGKLDTNFGGKPLFPGVDGAYGPQEFLIQLSF